MLRGLQRILLAVLLLPATLLPATLARAEGTVPNGYQVRASTALYGGVEHLVITNPDESVHVARVAPGAPVAMKAVSAYDAIPHRTADHELPSDMCRRVACIAGINGDFHHLDSDQPLGGVVSGGRMLRSPRAGYDQVTLARDGTLHAGALGWSGSLNAAGSAGVALGGVNVDRGANSVVLYTPAWGTSTPSGAENEIVLRAAAPVGALGATAVEIVSSRRRSGAIPPDGAVLSGVGPAGAALRALADRVAREGGSLGAQLELHTAVDAVESLGVHPVLLRDGRRAYPDVADGFTRSRSPRTLFGWNPAGEIVLVAVDGRRDDADGMTMAESADLLLSLGATDGVNFDGGGGTTFVVAGEVKNLPSDPGNPGPPAYPDGHVIAPGHVERMAPNALVIVPKPPDPAPEPVPSETTTTTAPGAGSGSGSGPGSTGPSEGGDLPFTSGDGNSPVGANGGNPQSPDDVGFLVGGTGSHERLLTPARDRSKGKKGKGKDGEAGAFGDPGDWLSGTSPTFPGSSSRPGSSALAFGGEEDEGQPVGLVFGLAGLLATGSVVVVLAGISRVRRYRRPRPALWL
jgi:hypothetical protein